MRRYAIQYLLDGDVWTFISEKYFTTQSEAITNFIVIKNLWPEAVPIATFRITAKTREAANMQLNLFWCSE